jgi:hypothetical protein
VAGDIAVCIVWVWVRGREEGEEAVCIRVISMFGVEDISKRL